MMSWPYPALIAHRGAGRLAPENTLAAMRVAAAMGMAAVEYDVKLSRDGVPVLLHDDTLQRTSDGRGGAGGFDFRELALLDFGSWHSPAYAGEPIPTLHAIAAFTRANGLASNIEIKPQPGREEDTGRQVALAALALWDGARVPPLLSSFSETALEAAMRAVPALPRALLLDDLPPADWASRAARLGCIAIHVDGRHATSELVQAVHGQGYKIAAWTVNTPEQARQLLQWGCDAIFTDAIDTLPRALQGLAPT